MPGKKWLTPPDVARLLGVGADRVVAWIRSGQLASANVGDGLKRPRFRISPESLEAFLASRAAGPAPRVAHRRKAKEPMEWY
jgi:excisionase family DNA binding protein